jgi:hypothetical protein
MRKKTTMKKVRRSSLTTYTLAVLPMLKKLRMSVPRCTYSGILRSMRKENYLMNSTCTETAISQNGRTISSESRDNY